MIKQVKNTQTGKNLARKTRKKRKKFPPAKSYDLNSKGIHLHNLILAVEQNPNSIIITDTKGNIEYVNQKFLETSGYSKEEIIGQNPRIMQSGKTNAKVYSNLWESITHGKQWYGSFLNKKKSGDLFWESISISPIFNSDGTLTNFVAVKEDITEQKKKEEQLFKRNYTLRALKHSGHALVTAENEKEYLQEICNIITQYCGYSLVWIGIAAQDESKSVHPVVSGGFDQGYLQKLNITWADEERGRGPTGTAIRTGKPSFCNDMQNDLQFKPWREEAIKRGYASSVALPLKENGKVFGAISIYSNHTGAFSPDEITLLSELADDLVYGISVIKLRRTHTLAEKELKKQHDLLEELIKQRTKELETANEILKEAQEVAHIGHWHLDLINNHLTWSDEVYRIFGVNKKSFGANLEAFLRLVHPDDREFVAASYKEAVERKTFYNINHRIIHPDGKIHIVHEQCITHYSHEGNPIDSLGVVQDITEIKNAEKEIQNHKNQLEELVKLRTEQLDLVNRQLKEEIEKEKQVELLLKESLEKERELNELKSRLISTTSHEFRTPLTSILSSVQLIQRYRQKWSDEKLEDQFLKVKNSIFNLTKLLDDILTISYADSGKIIFNPKIIDLKQVCIEVIEEIKHKVTDNHNFVFDFSSDEKDFVLDPKLIRFIIINLLSNAFKYSPDGGKVKLNFSSSAENIRILVSDKGIGIAKEDMEHLFKPFYRSSHTREIEGTGLGLSIVQRAVELHKGTIKCYSKPGKGAKFIVKIPKEQ